jgi:selenocysteine lyase/cysteine desulfurase
MARAVDAMATADRPDALALADDLRQKIAALINVDPSGVAITRSTAHGISLLAGGLRWREGDNVVAAQGDYPASIYPWMVLADQGVELRIVPEAEVMAGPDAILRHVDHRTRVVCVNHVQFASGYRLDVAAIGAACRERGVLLCVDVMHSLGAVEVDVQAMQADVVASGAHKWLMGPGSTAFCYLRPDLIPTIPPLIAGALSVVDRFNFINYRPLWAPDAHRFEETWLSAPGLAGMAAAVDLATTVGVERIEREVLRRTAMISDTLVEAGMRLSSTWPRPAARAAGIVCFEHPNVDSSEVLGALRSARVVASRRGSFVRLSPHYHNPEDEIAHTLDVITHL